MSKTVYSHCRGCVSSCGLVFEVEDDKIIAQTGNRESLVSAGYKCIKGDLSVEFLKGEEFRYETSQKRNADGELEPIDNDELMDELAQKVRESVEKYGPRSVALYFGTAGYRKAFNLAMARQFMEGIGSPLIFSTMTIDQSAHWVVEGRMGMFGSGRPFFEDVDVIALTGTNPVISHSSPYQATPLVNQTRKLRAFSQRGGKLIVVDPRKTETARQADLHIQCRPGTDTEIFAAMIHIVLKNNWQDQAFCDRYIQNLDTLRESVAAFAPERVADRAGITVGELEQAAQWIAHAKKPSVGFGTGTSMSPNANTAGHMVEALNAICGGFARAGDRVRNPGIFAKRPTAEMVIPPTRSWDAEPKLRTGHGMLYGEFPSSRLADEILTPGEGQIRTLFVLGANPMMAFGQPDRFQQALESLDNLIVIEPRKTETTELADYIVAPPIQYEVADFNLTSSTINPEAPVVQYTDPVVPPPPGTITEWEFFNGLANRLGQTLKLAATAFGGGGSAGATDIEPGAGWTTEKLIEKTFDQAGLSLEEVKKHPHGMLVEYPEQFITAPESDDGARLDVCPPDVAAELAEIAGEQDAVERPYQLVNRRVMELMNSEFRDAAAVDRRFPNGPPLFMNPDDIERDGFKSGDVVTLTGEHGHLQATVTTDRSLRSGVVSMPHCWKGKDGRHTSWLVSLKLEHVQKFDAMPQQSAIAVSIK